MHGNKVQEGTGAERDITVHGRAREGEGDRGSERYNGARGRCTGAREGAGTGPGQSAITVHADAITVHGDGARVHGKVQRTGAERVHGDGVRVHGKVQEGTGAERDNGARACTGRCRGPGQRAITVHGDGARVKCRGPSTITVHGDSARIDGNVEGNGGRAR